MPESSLGSGERSSTEQTIVLTYQIKASFSISNFLINKVYMYIIHSFLSGKIKIQKGLTWKFRLKSIPFYFVRKAFEHQYISLFLNIS